MRRALALRMGYPRRILSRLMTYAEFMDWAREFAKEPFDDRRCFDQPAAELRAMYVNSKRRENTAPTPWPEFMPYVDAESVLSIDEQVDRFL